MMAKQEHFDDNFNDLTSIITILYNCSQYITS